MKTLIILIVILLAVLSTPLSLKKLIDRSKVQEKAKGGLSEWIDDPLLNGSALAEKEGDESEDDETPEDGESQGDAEEAPDKDAGAEGAAPEEDAPANTTPKQYDPWEDEDDE